MAHQCRQCSFAARVERKHLLKGVRGLGVVEELFVVNARNSLEKRDFLARRCAHRHLLLEVYEQLRIAAGAAVDAVETANSSEATGVELEGQREAPLCFRKVGEIVFVDFTDPRERLGACGSRKGLGLPLEELDVAGPVSVALVEPREGVDGLMVARIFREIHLVEGACAAEVVQAGLKGFGGF